MNIASFAAKLITKSGVTDENSLLILIACSSALIFIFVSPIVSVSFKNPRVLSSPTV